MHFLNVFIRFFTRFDQTRKLVLFSSLIQIIITNGTVMYKNLNEQYLKGFFSFDLFIRWL